MPGKITDRWRVSFSSALTGMPPFGTVTVRGSTPEEGVKNFREVIPDLNIIITNMELITS